MNAIQRHFRQIQSSAMLTGVFYTYCYAITNHRTLIGYFPITRIFKGVRSSSRKGNSLIYQLIQKVFKRSLKIRSFHATMFMPLNVLQGSLQSSINHLLFHIMLINIQVSKNALWDKNSYF